MAQDPGLESKAFPFIRCAPRPSKPREAGLTIVADRGLGMNRVEDLIAAAGDYIDVFKIAIGAWRLQSEEFLKTKIAALNQAGIQTFFAGDTTEAAFQQGVSEEFYQAVKAIGADAVEVSSAQVTMSLADKCALIEMAGGAGLKVVAEAGQKGHEDWTRSLPFVLKQIEAYQEAGAWKVLVQGEGISEGVEERKEDLLLNIAAKFDIKDLIFQAKDSATQEWFVSTLGNGVNLDVDDHQVLDVELMRRGLRKRGVFGLLGSL
ncbi:MAG: phosphosulfolactate synthase [Alphaproteobacteria bacterium]|nr:phosphosulfolactate synthase [Alphaproteobacteria bacterium]